MSFVDTFTPTIVEKIGGEDVTFNLLTCDDYATWIERLHEEQKAESKKEIPDSATASERIDANRKISKEPSLQDIGDLVWTMTGAKKVLDVSLFNAGVTVKADRAAIIRKIRPRQLVPLALRVSDLFDIKPKDSPPTTGATPGPNSEKPDDAGSTATG